MTEFREELIELMTVFVLGGFVGFMMGWIAHAVIEQWARNQQKKAEARIDGDPHG